MRLYEFTEDANLLPALKFKDKIYWYEGASVHASVVDEMTYELNIPFDELVDEIYAAGERNVGFVEYPNWNWVSRDEALKRFGSWDAIDYMDD